MRCESHCVGHTSAFAVIEGKAYWDGRKDGALGLRNSKHGKCTVSEQVFEFSRRIFVFCKVKENKIIIELHV